MTFPFFVPPALMKASERYYRLPSPSDQLGILWSCFLQPLLVMFAMMTVVDPTYGRASLPRAPEETALRNNPEIEVQDCKAHLHRGEFISYQIWHNKKAAKAHNNSSSLLLCHGINDYGSKWATHAPRFLALGWRLLIPDLPGHARSSGLHVYITSTQQFIEALDAVLNDLVARDAANGQTESQTFLAGASMGGFACASYGIYRSGSATMSKAAIAGVVLLCPMLEVAPESRPSHAVESAARVIKSVAGPNKGKNSDDQTLELEFEMDPQTYHGKLRIATGLAFLKGMSDLSTRFHEMRLPFLCIHGTGDRVTSYRETQRFHLEAASTDKDIKLFGGYEHILLRRGRDAQDDMKRQKVLDAWIDWLEERRIK